MEKLYEGKFRVGTDYMATFSEEVDKLITQDLTIEFKNKLIEGITDAYISQTGDIPDPYELTRLGTWLVTNKDDNHVDKVTREEYPVLSESQIKLRQRRELVSDRLDYKSESTQHRINGKRKPKVFKVFGQYD